MPWIFLGFPKYNLVAISLPHLDPASGFFTQGTSRTSIPSLKTAGQTLVSQWKLLTQILYSSWLLEISLTAMHLFDVFIYDECTGYPKIFYILDISLNRFLWANIKGVKKKFSTCIFIFCSLTEVLFNLLNVCSSILLTLSFNGIIQK